VTAALDLPRIHREALQIARDAGALLLDGHRRELVVEHKGEVDLVTQVDLASERLVIDRLQRAFPGHRVIGEESGLHEADEAVGDGRPLWYVDPLDGTTNYAHRLPWYAVSLALELDGVAQVGVVLAPACDWEFSAIRGQGAHLNGEPLSVSRTTTARAALVATGFPYHRRRFDNVDNVRAVLESFQGLRRVGSAALDCAMVAAGWLDAYWEYTVRPWDIAAGALLAREAGGKVTAADGSPFRSGAGSILASNGQPALHERLAALVRGPLPDPAKDDAQRPPGC